MSEHVENGKFAAVLRRGLSVAATLALILAGAAAARAQSASSSTAVQSTKSAAPSSASASATAKAAANPAAAPPLWRMNTGIKIHGHWKIVVRNPDGTVATRRDFENSLSYSGAFIMQTLLGGNASPGAWAIGLGAQLAGNTGPCTDANFSILQAVDPVPNFQRKLLHRRNQRCIRSNLTCSPITGCSPNLSRQQI